MAESKLPHDFHIALVYKDSVNTACSLQEFRDELPEKLLEGTICPLCTRYMKLYQRNINKQMASVLIVIDRFFSENPTAEWLHVTKHLMRLGVGSRFAGRGGDWAKMVHWGLLISKRGQKPDGNPSLGLWRITELGKAFIHDGARVPKYMFMFKKACYGFSTETMSIYDAVATPFDYNEMLRSLKEDRDEPAGDEGDDDDQGDG